MRDLWLMMQYGPRQLPKFSGSSCDECWEFKGAFKRFVKNAVLTDRRSLELLYEAYAGEGRPRIGFCLREKDSEVG